MFFSLLAAKVWGWIGEGRVEILEQQPPQNPRWFHTRLAISLSLSVLFDSYMLEYLIKQVLNQARPDMMVMFGFEFAVLTILSTSTMARYAISLVEIYAIRKQKEKRAQEIRMERRAAAVEAMNADVVNASSTEDTAPQAASTSPSSATASATTPSPVEEPIDDAELEVEGWEEKGRWIFYLDLGTGLIYHNRNSFSTSANFQRRLPQARRLPFVLFHPPCILRTPYSHHARRVSHLSIFLQAHQRLHEIPNSHERHEREISRCHGRRDCSGGHLYYLSRRDEASTTSQRSGWCGTACSEPGC